MARQKRQVDIFVAKQTFFVGDELITAGVTRVREGHALLRGRADMFERLDVQYDVEQATAAPAEQRRTTTRAPKTPNTGKPNTGKS